MDFNRNPLPVPGDLPFSLDRLDDDVSAYLSSAGADQDMPIDRLRHMNPLAIELYRRYKVDITTTPLEFAVNHQHMNGGIAVDVWGRSNVTGIYAIGEAAGTHGVTRPGGAALNAGQVFGTRAAEHIAASGIANASATGALAEPIRQAIAEIKAVLRSDDGLPITAIRDEIQARMSDRAGIICRSADVHPALIDARALCATIRTKGIRFRRASEVTRALQWHQMALASQAVLEALDHFVAEGGGSRGARAICDVDGDATPMSRAGPLDDVRFRSERQEHQSRQILVRLEGGTMKVSTRPNRTYDETAKTFFERDWPDWLTGEIYDRR
jgi:aspartate oxidase